MKYLVPVIAIIFLYTMCTPYNSDKANHQLIQGKWLLTDVDNAIYDSVQVDYSEEETFLVFKDNICTQLMPDLKDTTNFTFDIRDYSLNLYQDTALVNTIGIAVLTSDSLALSLQDGKRIYKKIEQ